MSDVVVIPVSEQPTVLAVSNDTVVVPVPGSTAILVGLARGPAGENATTDLSYTAGASLGGHRMVRLDSNGQLQYADSSILSQCEVVLGMTTGAISSGATGTVRRTGEVTEPSWSWTLGLPIFLGTSGQLTQTPPVGGFLLQVAFPITSTKVFIDIKQSLVR